MTFANEKKTFLDKLDKSKKGGIDQKVVSLINKINQNPDYYTTSSCSGRVCLWQGTGKKNETEWLKVSHNLINNDFFEVNELELVWLRLEPFIIHVACRDLGAANRLLEKARLVYKKSCLLSSSNKIIIEIRGSEFLEMPFSLNENILFNGDLNWLTELINQKFERIFSGINKFEELIKEK